MRSWEEHRGLAAGAAILAAALHVLAGFFWWRQLGGGVPVQLALNGTLREVDGLAGGLVLGAAVVAATGTDPAAALVRRARLAATVLLVLAAVQVVNGLTLRGDQVETADRLQTVLEGGLPAAVLAGAARRITAPGRGGGAAPG